MTTDVYKALGLSGHSNWLKGLSSIGATAALMKAISPPPGIADALRWFDADRKDRLTAAQSVMPRLHGFAADFISQQHALTQTLSRLFGPGSTMQGIAITAGLASEQYTNMFGPTSEFARSLALAQPRLDGISASLLEIQNLTAGMSRSMGDYGQFVSRISKDLLDSPMMKTVQDAMRVLGAPQVSVGVDDVRATPTALRSLDVLGLQGLVEQLLGIAERINADQLGGAAELDTALSKEEEQAVREASDAVATVLENRFSSLEARLEQVNATIAQLAKLLKKEWRVVVVVFLLVTTWDICKNVAASYVYAYLLELNTAVQAAAPSSMRAADAVRESRRAAADLRLPTDVVRVFRVVNRRAVPVFDSEDPNAPPVAKIHLGQICEVMTSAGKWRYVRWPAGDEEVHEGWVRAKYLDKLTR